VQSASVGNSIELNQYIDLVVADGLCRLLIRQSSNDAEMVESRKDPVSELAAGAPE